MNQVIIYHFTIKAISPVYFGDSQAGELVTNAENKPVLLGNAIGGALRDYLKKTTIPAEIILKYMGGEDKEGEKEKFRESGIYISDGEVDCSKFCTKEGTAINPEYGTAQKMQKYTLKHWPEGTEIRFCIECNEWTKRGEGQAQQLCPAEFDKLIGTWARGIAEQKLLLGGQKSNGFGRFELEELEKTVFVFNNSAALDEYIFNREGKPAQLVDWKRLAYYKLKPNDVITFCMEGQFAYGVYQGFTIERNNLQNSYTLTGLQQKKQNGYFLPSTSLKGLIKSEVRLLLKRVTGDDGITEKKCNELFGDTEQKGKLVFSDVHIEGGKKVEIERYVREEQGHPVYIKIDRLTGGAYSSAVKHQQEIQGMATIRFDLMEDSGNDGCNPYIFPLAYVMRRIGAGLVPVGGRTAIGLGQFAAGKVSVALAHDWHELETDGLLSEPNREWLENHFDSFKRWCSKQ